MSVRGVNRHIKVGTWIGSILLDERHILVRQAYPYKSFRLHLELHVDWRTLARRVDLRAKDREHKYHRLQSGTHSYNCQNGEGLGNHS